jgi:hypothetical protein
VDLTLDDSGVEIVASASCFGRTGIEMEALTAVTVAALTVYDMCKAADKAMVMACPPAGEDRRQVGDFRGRGVRAPPAPIWGCRIPRKPPPDWGRGGPDASYDEALARILAAADPLPAERVPLADARAAPSLSLSSPPRTCPRSTTAPWTATRSWR